MLWFLLIPVIGTKPVLKCGFDLRVLTCEAFFEGNSGMIRSVSCEDIDPVNEIKLSNIVLGKLKVMKIAMGLGYNLCYVVKFGMSFVTWDRYMVLS